MSRELGMLVVGGALLYGAIRIWTPHVIVVEQDPDEENGEALDVSEAVLSTGIKNTVKTGEGEYVHTTTEGQHFVTYSLGRDPFLYVRQRNH